MKPNISKMLLCSWMIGDTETDIIAAQTHGIRAIGVLSGIRDIDRLKQYQPDLIVDNLAAAVKFVYTTLSDNDSRTDPRDYSPS